MIDIGVNLTSNRFDKDRHEVITRAKIAGLSAILITGTNVKESQQAVNLCSLDPQFLYSTAGVHPHDADNVSSNYLVELERLASSPQVRAIGECGLDFNRNFSTPENQQHVFQEQVLLAERLSLPLFLHQRDAFKPWFNILEPHLDSIPAMVAHCFTGSEMELQQCLEADMYIGITGWVCDERRGKPLYDIVKHIPLDRLMIETDAPYLTPRNIKPKPKSSRNEPAYLPYIVTTLAQAMSCSEQDIIAYSARNSARVFALE